MSRLDELIQELCPDGVEYKSLKEVFNTRNGYTPSKSKPEYWENGVIPWFRMEDIRANGNILKDAIQKVSRSAVKGEPFPAYSFIVATSATIGEHALITVPSLSNQRFTYLMLKTEYKNAFDVYFLNYYFSKLDEWCLAHLNQGGFASVDMGKFAEFEVPVPPLPVQQEIVRILDKFTELTAELNKKLTAELTARKKQYEYYRDELLTFGADVPRVRLDEIATDMYRGSGIKRNEVSETGFPCVRYGEIYTTYNTFFEECVSHTDESSIVNPKYFDYGAILFAITGESVEDIAKCVAYIGHERCMAGGDIVVMTHNQNPKYLSYALATADAREQKGKGKIKSKVVHSSVPALKEIVIPLPDRSVQDRIAHILDNYEFICNDISSGLPAEIEARQKQYEYYRDKLLSFKRKETE